MKDRNIFVACLPFMAGLLLFANAFTLQAQKIKAISTLEHFEKRTGATTGMLVQSPEGETLLSHNAEHLFCPASITKIISTGAALELLGPNHRYETNIYLDGTIQGQTLQGDLVIVGGGDPALNSRYIPQDRGRLMRDIMRALENKGIHKIEGNIIIDASLYGTKGISDTWPLDDIGNYYGAAVYGFNYADNSMSVYLNSMAKAVRIVHVEPATPALNWKLTLRRGKRDSVYCYCTPLKPDMLITGTIPAGRRNYELRVAMPDPANMAVTEIANELTRQAGIVHQGKTLATYTPHEMQAPARLLKYVSYKLDTLARVTNFRSVNSYAEAITKSAELKLGSKQPGQSMIRPYGIMKYWTERLNIPATQLQLYDGSGLSPMGRLSPLALGTILEHLADNSTFRQTLPQAGKEGSVKGILQHAPFEAHLKSGSMSGVVSYAGYVTWQGNTYVVVFVSNGARSNSQARVCFQQALKELFI